MKVAFIKQPGGVMMPASDMEAERLIKFKTGELYEMEIKNSRNPSFHRKVFAFFNFCFEYWSSDKEFLTEQAQFDKFRGDLTIIAGYYDKVYNYKLEARLVAKSLAFGSMTQEEFELLYTALINAASKNIFGDKIDDETYEKLMSFFL